MVERSISPENMVLLAKAVAQLNAEPDRPGTKKACLQIIADRLGWSWATVKARVYFLRMRVIPDPKKRPKKAWEIK